MKEAKQHAATSVSASLFHFMWLVGLRDSERQPDGAIAQAIADAEEGKPLKESTFKQEMARPTKHLNRVETDAHETVRKAQRRERWYFIAGLAVALIGILVSVV